MNEGRIEQVGAPEEVYGYPKNRFVADFIGTINLLPVSVNSVGDDGLRLSAAGLGEVACTAASGAAAGEHGVIALRPEQLAVLAGDEPHGFDNHFVGTVRDHLYLGDVTVYRIALDNGVVLEALLANSLPGRAKSLDRGDVVGVGWRREAGVFLRD